MPPNPATLPTIDISPFLPSTISSSPTALAAARARTATALAHACHDPGFFYLTNHAIPPSTLTNLLALTRRFFLEAPPAAKAAIARRDVGAGGDGARGYQRVGENVTKGGRDWHEGVDLYAEAPEGMKGEGEVLGGSNLWPEWPGELRGEVEGYVGRVREVGTAVVGAMGVALGLEGEEAEVFVRATRRSFWVMRLIGYPGLPGGEGEEEGFSCGEHTGMFSCEFFFHLGKGS